MRTSQISIFSVEGGSAAVLKNLGINVLKTAGMFNISGDWNWRHNIAGRPLLFWPVGILFLAGVLSGLRALFKKISHSVSREQYLQSYALLFSWLIIAALPVVISNEGLPHALRAIIMIPPVFILAAIGGHETYNWLSKKNIKTNPTHHYLHIACLARY